MYWDGWYICSKQLAASQSKFKKKRHYLLCLLAFCAALFSAEWSLLFSFVRSGQFDYWGCLFQKAFQVQRNHFKFWWLSEGKLVLPCLKTSKTVMMLRGMFLLALGSLSDTCIIAAVVYMSLVHFHTSRQHWECWSVTNKVRKKWSFFQV